MASMFTTYSLCQKKHTINPLFFCGSQDIKMEPKIDLADHVYGSCKYAQFFGAEI